MLHNRRLWLPRPDGSLPLFYKWFPSNDPTKAFGSFKFKYALMVLSLQVNSDKFG
jgi:hypothetical protein